MIQPSGQRGGLPPHHLLNAKPGPAGRPAQGQPQFGAAAQGAKLGKGLADSVFSGFAKVVPVSIFEQITQVFLAGFLAQDVLAMWVPRIWTSLKTGAEPYDPSNDPTMRNRPFKEQARMWAHKNWDGLNWVNFNEETKREFATGPGLLAVPAFMFLGNRYLGNHARELSYQSLKGLGYGFSEHLNGQKALNADKYWQEIVPNYITSVFADPKLMEEGSDSRKAIVDWSQNWAKELREQEKAGGWQRFKDSTSRFFHQSKPSIMENYAKELNDTIRQFNRSGDARTLPYEVNAVIRDEAPLHHAEHTWVSYRPDAFKRALAKSSDTAALEEAKGLCAQVPVSHLTGDLKRFGGLVRATWQNYEKEMATSKPAAISEVAASTLKGLAGSKVALGVGTTALAGAYLLKLAFWAQNHKSYQAVRLLRDDAARGAAAHPSSAQSAQPMQQRGVASPVQTGLPFAAQPVFSSQRFAAVPGAPRAYSFKESPNPFAGPYMVAQPVAGFQGRPVMQAPVDWRRA